MKEPSFEVKMNEYLPLRDVVFHTLRQAILKGDLKPGERLMEIQLAKKLGVSRTPIREAIRKLELEGLVLMIPRKGEVRGALEKLAVQLACDQITKAQIHELREAAGAFREALTSGNVTEIAEADEHFHDLINLATGNQKLIQLLNNLREQMYRYRVEYLKNEAVYPQLLSEHDSLIRAIEKRQREQAAEIVCRHIENQAEAISGTIRTKSGRKE